MTTSAANSMKYWADVIGSHASRYPLSSAQDWYKLIYQGTLGAEHLLQDVPAARQRLQVEWDAVEAQTGAQCVCDAIAPENRIVRLHLRPLKALGCPVQTLWTAFEKSAALPTPGKADFVDNWRRLKQALPAADVEAWDHIMASQGYPVCHHSPVFRQAYRPAYRVVHLQACDRGLLKWINAIYS